VSTKDGSEIHRFCWMHLWLLWVRMRSGVPPVLLHSRGAGMLRELPGPVEEGTGGSRGMHEGMRM
jgi:hypothetical protein